MEDNVKTVITTDTIKEISTDIYRRLKNAATKTALQGACKALRALDLRIKKLESTLNQHLINNFSFYSAKSLITHGYDNRYHNGSDEKFTTGVATVMLYQDLLARINDMDTAHTQKATLQANGWNDYEEQTIRDKRITEDNTVYFSLPLGTSDEICKMFYEAYISIKEQGDGWVTFEYEHGHEKPTKDIVLNLSVIEKTAMLRVEEAPPFYG